MDDQTHIPQLVNYSRHFNESSLTRSMVVHHIRLAQYEVIDLYSVNKRKLQIFPILATDTAVVSCINHSKAVFRVLAPPNLFSDPMKMSASCFEAEASHRLFPLGLLRHEVRY